MDSKRSVTVDVAGQRLTLRTDADEEYVQRLARYVSDKINEAKAGSSKTISTNLLAILAAMTIADDLFQVRDRADASKQRLRAKVEHILGLLGEKPGR